MEAVEIRMAAGAAAGVVVEQRVAHALKGLELESHPKSAPSGLNAFAVGAVAELRVLGIEVAVRAQPDMRGSVTGSRSDLAGSLIELLDA